MVSRTRRITGLASCLCGTAALLLALGAIRAAGADPDAKLPKAKDQPKTAGGKKEAAKKKDEKPAVKLGLWINDPRALQGYTVLAPLQSSKTYLLDMQGRVVRTWESDCSPALHPMLLDNGHLLRPGSIGEDSRVFGPGPGVGGRIQEFTWDGELVWDFKFYNSRQLPHHDITRMPNGNILMIVWDRKTNEEAIAAGRRPELIGDKHLLPDSIVEIKPTGKTTGAVVWEWHLWDHLVQDFDKTKANYGNVAQHPELVNINYGEDEIPKAGKDKDKSKADAKKKSGDKKEPPRIFRANPDMTHFNGVAYNAELDQIAVSVHAFSEFWIIDHSTTTAEAAGHTGGRRGKGGDLLYRWGNPRAYRAGTKADQTLFSQHNAHWIPRGLPGEGHLLVFNNGGGRPGGPFSSVDELALPVDSQGHYAGTPGKGFAPAKPVWSYTAPKKKDFYSSFISGSQRLANGNTLICSGANGTVFEVTPAKEIVWKYVNPVKGGNMGFGAPRRPGQIMSMIAGEMLGVSAVQRKQFDEIQKEVDRRLDKLLTAEQKKKFAERPKDGGPGLFGPPAPPGKIMPDPERNRLKLTDEQKKAVASLQKDIDEKMNKVLNEAQRKQLKTVFAPFGPPAGVAFPGARPSQQPGQILSPQQQDALKLSPDQRKQLASIQKDIDARLNKLLTQEQRNQLVAMKSGPGPGIPPGPPGGSPPGGTPLFRAYRYAASHPAFVGKKLTPGKTIE
jgi:Spy/CpxP family protein refolding chaperone